MFCKSLVLDDEGEVNQTIYTIVNIELNKTGGFNQARYLKFFNPIVDFDFMGGFQFIGYE